MTSIEDVCEQFTEEFIYDLHDNLPEWIVRGGHHSDLVRQRMSQGHDHEDHLYIRT